jgi:hypothetical protein
MNKYTGLAALATILLLVVGLASSALADPAAETPANDQHVQLTFTKWVTVNNPGAPVMQGITGGDVPGKFVGQVMDWPPPTSDLVSKPYLHANGDITVLQAVYEVDAADPNHSFRALVQGGQDVPTNRALLDGVVLGGWLTGDKVHVEFQQLTCDKSNAGAQPNALGGLCFQGTITLFPGSES